MSNVKPGQLAMFKPGNDNAGRIVRVVAADNEPLLQMILAGTWWTCEAMQHIQKWRWFRNTPNGFFAPGEHCPVPDMVLMPLHDGDGTDETLTWGIKPVQRDETLTPRRQVEHAR